MSLPEDTELYSFVWDQPVPAHRHKNLDGTVGGWVANTAFVAAEAYVAESAVVFGNARILAPARIGPFASVFGHCQILAPVDVGEWVVLADKGIVRRQADIRWGCGWSAHAVLDGVCLRFAGPTKEAPIWLESWSDLPESLYRRGLISEMEYLAWTVAELEPERAP